MDEITVPWFWSEMMLKETKRGLSGERGQQLDPITDNLNLSG